MSTECVGGQSWLLESQPVTSRNEQLAALSVRHAVPAIYQSRSFAASGGLLSYGADSADVYRLTGIYVGRILKGEKPADLPVQQATKVELYINLKTAKALGITIPNTLIGRARGKAYPFKKWYRRTAHSIVAPLSYSHADPTGDCDRACAVCAPMEHWIYRRASWPAVYRTSDLSGRADGFRRGHHGRDCARGGCTLALCE